MSFDSVDFLLFFPIVALAYYIIPVKTKYNLRNVWLLIASYYFYMSWNAKYVLLILFSTLVTYFCGIFLGKINASAFNDKQSRFYKNLILAISFIINLSILGYFKYGQFFLHNLSNVLARAHVSFTEPKLNILLPVGISFYTFQALGYTMDVYRGDIEPERNFIQYALFVSFFPQLVAGPIERSKNLISQLKEEHYFDLDVICEGLLMMLWGFFMKLVIADRAAVFVDTVYDNYTDYMGWYLVIASILFVIQVYCDFNGYTMIAKGAAKIMGFRLIDNFDAPYLAGSMSEFWKRWHMSLTSWFRDYLYIPLGGNRKGKLRKYINILIVFSVSGLWHGADWHYVAWGVINGLYQVAGDILNPIKKKFLYIFKLNKENLGNKTVSVLFTFQLWVISMVFFRADSIKDAIVVLRKMFHMSNIWILLDHESLFTCGLNRYDMELLLFALLVLLIADIFRMKKISIMRDIIFKQDTWCRWTVYIVSFLFVLVFGIWGSGYENAAFLYFQF